ncbi:hypothetical protein [Sphingomonas xanthus]|uniref:Uncharacterized protein n=1 Tax=Sphingomonas xanthus TaxID=2594473 RepID=A0A516IQZ3_9SPHN|nr:hypothetical protein [Sphingomonas xanthus]QDP19289.1 hypothetical protein FMM02_04500 [Sphingomonas xanthus]
MAENALAPSDDILFEAGAATNSAERRTMRDSAVPTASALGWSYDRSQRLARFGSPAAPAFTLQCQVQVEGPRQLVITRHAAASAGQKGTLSFTAGGATASVPVDGVADPSGVGGHWRAIVPQGDMTRAVQRVFAGPATVEVSVGGIPPLVVPTGRDARQVLADCQ